MITWCVVCVVGLCLLEDSAHHLKHHSCSYSSCHIESCREIEETCSQSCIYYNEDRSQQRHAAGPPPVCLQMTVGIHAGALQQPRSFSRVNAPNPSPVLNVIVNRHGDRRLKLYTSPLPKMDSPKTLGEGAVGQRWMASVDDLMTFQKSGGYL